MAATWKGRCTALALWVVPIIGMPLFPARAQAEMLVGRFSTSGTIAIEQSAFDAAGPAQESPAAGPDHDYFALGLELAVQFFPPHYGQPPPQHTPPPPGHHNPPPVDNPPPTDHAPEPATLVSGALGMGLLSLYAAARRRKHKKLEVCAS